VCCLCGVINNNNDVEALKAARDRVVRRCRVQPSDTDSCRARRGAVDYVAATSSDDGRTSSVDTTRVPGVSISRQSWSFERYRHQHLSLSLNLRGVARAPVVSVTHRHRIVSYK